MKQINLQNICRLCMVDLDNGFIDCLNQTELRENIEMIYNIEICKSDEFSTKICSHCCNTVIQGTVHYIRATETQINLKTALRLQNELKSTSQNHLRCTGIKRPLFEDQMPEEDDNKLEVKRKCSFVTSVFLNNGIDKPTPKVIDDCTKSNTQNIKSSASTPKKIIETANTQVAAALPAKPNATIAVESEKISLDVKNTASQRTATVFQPYKWRKIDETVSLTNFHSWPFKNFSPIPMVISDEESANKPPALNTSNEKSTFVSPDVLNGLVNTKSKAKVFQTENSFVRVAKELYTATQKPSKSTKNIDFAPAMEEITKRMASLRLSLSKILNQKKIHTKSNLARFGSFMDICSCT